MKILRKYISFEVISKIDAHTLCQKFLCNINLRLDRQNTVLAQYPIKFFKNVS